MEERIMEAWHFTNGTKLRDGRDVPPPGEWLEHEQKLVLCEAGLHASRRLLDALGYAPGTTVHRVEISGQILTGVDKVCGERRKILWSLEIEQVLRGFARFCAWCVLPNWDAPEVVKEWVLTGNEQIRNAAWDAVSNADWNAAWSAAGSAAWSAAKSATWDATWDASWDASWSASWEDARDAAKIRELLEQVLVSALEAARKPTPGTAREGEENE
jgi:hypothetical protein